MNIEVLYFSGCPNHEPTVDLVRDVVATLNLSLEVREVEVVGPEQADALRFIGSPSVRVDGIDIEPSARDCTEYSLSCRLYGRAGVPPRALLIAALEALK
jgi:hypothetical protein